MVDSIYPDALRRIGREGQHQQAVAVDGAGERGLVSREGLGGTEVAAVGPQHKTAAGGSRHDVVARQRTVLGSEDHAVGACKPRQLRRQVGDAAHVDAGAGCVAAVVHHVRVVGHVGTAELTGIVVAEVDIAEGDAQVRLGVVAGQRQQTDAAVLKGGGREVEDEVEVLGLAQVQPAIVVGGHLSLGVDIEQFGAAGGQSAGRRHLLDVHH